MQLLIRCIIAPISVEWVIPSSLRRVFFVPILPGDSSQQSVLDRSELYSHPERYRYYIWFASRETYWKNESLRPANYGKPSLYDTVLSYTIEELKAMNYRVVYRGKPVTP